MHALCSLRATISRWLNDRPTPRNYLKESRELKNRKELKLAYPYEQVAAILLTRKICPPRKRTLILHDLALGMLPVLLTFHGTLALEDGESNTFKISTPQNDSPRIIHSVHHPPVADQFGLHH